MIYTMPRMTTRLNLQADRLGTFDGVSGHFSGDGFPGMQFKVAVGARRPVRDVGRRGRAGGPDAGRGAATPSWSKPSSYVKPITYGGVAPGLFEAIVGGARAAQPGAPAAPITAPSTDRSHDVFRQTDLARDPVRRADPVDHLRGDAGGDGRDCHLGLGARVGGPICGNIIHRPDHKRIGVMYIVLGLLMLVRGFADAIMMRAQQPLAIGASQGYLPPEHYNRFSPPTARS